MRPVGQNIRQSRLGDTQPMRPVSPAPGYSTYRNAYRESIDRRREMLRTSQPQAEHRRNRPAAKAKRGSVSRLLAERKRRAGAAAGEMYFDYELLRVIIFLMCFGLVMLYSVSSYEADADFGNDLYYFTRQALIGAAGFVVMFLVSKIDYHIYGAFAVEIYVFAMFMMALVRTPLGLTLNGARRWIKLPAGQTLQPAEITKIAVILFISYELCRLGKKAYTLAGIARVLAFGAIASGGVLFLTDNLSTAIIVMAITCILIFVIHPKTKPFVVIIIAAVILVSTWRLLSESLRLTLDGTPCGIDPDSVVAAMEGCAHVENVHHVHIWAMSTTVNALTAHVVIDDTARMEQAKADIKARLAALGIAHSTLEMETRGSRCADHDHTYVG